MFGTWLSIHIGGMLGKALAAPAAPVDLGRWLGPRLAWAASAQVGQVAGDGAGAENSRRNAPDRGRRRPSRPSSKARRAPATASWMVRTIILSLFAILLFQIIAWVEAVDLAADANRQGRRRRRSGWLERRFGRLEASGEMHSAQARGASPNPKPVTATRRGEDMIHSAAWRSAPASGTTCSRSAAAQLLLADAELRHDRLVDLGQENLFVENPQLLDLGGSVQGAGQHVDGGHAECVDHAADLLQGARSVVANIDAHESAEEVGVGRLVHGHQQ